MLRIKLSRRGKKKQPVYRILIIEKQKDPWGTFLENVGTYNPRTTPSEIKLNEERIKYWISKGAQPTDTVHNLLVDAGVIQGKKRNNSKLGKKAKEKVKEEAEKGKENSDGSDKKTDASDKKPAEEAPKEEPKAEEAKPEEEPAEEAPKEETKPEEKSAEEAKEEKPAE